MPKRKVRREIYDYNYYRAKELLLNPTFKKRIVDLKTEFAKFGCPIPKGGFKTVEEYMDWNKNKFWKIYVEREASKEYKAKIKEITKNKDTYGSKEAWEIEEFREKFLPPIYGKIFEDILEEFGIDRKDKGFDDFLERHVFFNRDLYPTPLFSIKWIRNKKTEKMELFIHLYGHTRKEDIMNNWEQIAKDQEHLPGYRAKNKKWLTFERDNTVYELYLEIKRKRKKNRSSKNQGESPIDKEIYRHLSEKYPGLSLSTIRRIISKVKKFRVTPKDNL